MPDYNATSKIIGEKSTINSSFSINRGQKGELLEVQFYDFTLNGLSGGKMCLKF